MKITVGIVDDHTVVREGLRLLLEAYDSIQVVGTAADGNEAIEMVRAIHPSIVVMDISLPNLNGIEATREIRSMNLGTQVCILSMHSNLDYLYQALNAGAAGFILKEAAGSEVVSAIQSVVSGERYLSRKVVDLVIENFIKQYRPLKTADIFDALSSRERDILKRVASGQSSKEIAEILNLSPKTVETYRARMMDKLNVHDLPSLLRIYLEQKANL